MTLTAKTTMTSGGLDPLGAAVTLIMGFEGFRPESYLCPAGVPTIGFGTTRYPGGGMVSLDDPPVGRAQAEAWLRAALKDLTATLANCLAHAPSVNQDAAMLSLAYGIGAHAFASSRLVRCFNAGDVADAAAQFLVWDKAHVKGRLVSLPGLAARRAREKTLFETPDTAEVS